LHFVHHCA
jgi:hypothetical protein